MASVLVLRCSTSPPIHLVKLMGLAPATTYYYVVGDGSNMSPEYSFATLPAALPAAGQALQKQCAAALMALPSPFASQAAQTDSRYVRVSGMPSDDLAHASIECA
jgi:hypothetical protein